MYLWVLEEAKLEVHIHLDVFCLGATDSGDDDDKSLLTLELFYRPHLDLVKVSLLQDLAQLLTLCMQHNKNTEQIYTGASFKLPYYISLYINEPVFYHMLIKAIFLLFLGGLHTKISYCQLGQ